MTESNPRGYQSNPTDGASSTDSSTSSNAETTDRDVHATDLTQFQLNILTVLAEKERYGLAIKRALEDYYGETVHHGRLYPNLDELVEYDLVEKSELDKRTNQYELTDEGRELLQARLDWLTNHAAHVGVESHQQGPKDHNGDRLVTDGGEDTEADIYEVDVQLRQSAIVAVRADSREEAWESLLMPHDRDVQRALAGMQFTGAEYEPEDILAVNDIEEADIDLTEEAGDE